MAFDSCLSDLRMRRPCKRYPLLLRNEKATLYALLAKAGSAFFLLTRLNLPHSHHSHRFAMPNTNHPAAMPAIAAFRQAFDPLRATVYAEGTFFSGSQMSADLQALEPLAQRIGPASAEMAELRWLQCEVWRRRGGFEEEALQAGQQALAIDLATGGLEPAEQLMRHYRLGVIAEDSANWNIALHHLNATHALLQASHANTWTPTQQLCLRERIGYALHEAGHYAEALAHNQQLLQDAKQTAELDAYALRTLLNNLAQNAYELKDTHLAAQYLQERLRIVQAAQDTELACDSLFQLGVLACEQGQFEQAHQFFEQRLALAETANDDALRQQAQQDLQRLIHMAANAPAAPAP